MTPRDSQDRQMAIGAREGIRPLKWGRLYAEAMDDFVPDRIGDRLASLVDGEGCFSIHYNQANSQWSTDFVINIRWDDRGLLNRFRDELGGPGKIMRLSRRNHHRPLARWAIGNKAETLWLCSVLDFFPPWSKKARDYAVWRRAVFARSAGRGAGVSVLEECFHEIRAVREYTEEALVHA